MEAGLSPNAELVSAYPLPADPQAREQRRHQMELLAARQATWSRSELAEQARRSRLRPDDIPAPPPPPAEGIGRLHSIAVHASADPL